MTTLELIEVDPGTLIVGANVRNAAALDKPFLDSIAEHGVKQPIQAYRDDEGALVVVAGQRRTLAAVLASHPLVKVEVIDRPDDSGRIVDQVVENVQRLGMTDGDRLNAFTQLSLLGFSAAAIAKKTGHAPAIVTAALVVAGTQAAKTAVLEHDVDLVDSAVIAELADDDETADLLTRAAKSGNMKWAAQSVRDDRERKRGHAEALDALTATGVTVLDKRPEIFSGPIARLSDLAGTAGKKMRPVSHKKCPGHAAYIGEEYVSGKLTMAPVYVCTDFKKHGHTTTGWRADKKTSTDSTGETIARAEILKGNRDWKTATGLRRTWLRDFLKARSAPASAAGFVALALVVDSTVADAQNLSRNATAQYLLGVADEVKSSGHDHQDAFTALAEKASERRALVIALGIVLGAYERALSGMEWRSGTSTGCRRYLRYLQLLGYDLTPIELRACGEMPAADPDGTGEV